MTAVDTRSTHRIERNGRRRMAVLGVVASSMLALSAGPAAAGPAPAARPPIAKAPSGSVQQVPRHLAPGGGVSTLATYVHNTKLYYWGADALVSVSSGEVSLGVYCTGWGWYQTGWMGKAPDGTPGVWRARVDCGGFIPATQYRYQTRG